MKLDMLKTVHHVQRIRVFTSRLCSVRQCNFVSKASIKQQFLEGLNSASVCDVRSYAQVVSQGVKKNAVDCKNSCWNVGTANRIGKIPNMGTHAGAHKVTMCNNSRHIEKRTGDQVSDVNKKKLGKYQKRHTTYVPVHDSRDLSVLTRNRFDSLIVEPSLEESCDMADIGLVVPHSQENGTTGLNLLTVDPSLQKNCHMADSG